MAKKRKSNYRKAPASKKRGTKKAYSKKRPARNAKKTSSKKKPKKPVNRKNKKPVRSKTKKAVKGKPKKVSKGKKFKGVRYIALALQKYFPKRYTTYTAALTRARVIHADIISAGQDVVLREIFARERKKRGEKIPTEAPEIGPELLEPVPFYDLNDYPALISRESNQVWFKSKISPSELTDIQGGSDVDYNEYFKPFVDYCNKMVKLTEDEVTSDDVPLVCCKEPFFDKKTQRWISFIISCDSDGNEVDYGFDSGNPTSDPFEYVSNTGETKETAAKPEQKIEPSKPKAEGPSALDVEKEKTLQLKYEADRAKAEAEKSKSEERKMYNKMYMDGKITKDEWKDLIAGAGGGIIL